MPAPDLESPAFNPLHPGTLDAQWDSVLKNEPVLAIPQGPLLIVSPHPDDEVLGAGGLMRAAAQAGADVSVLSVSDGEAAYPDWRGLGGIRRRELVHALSVLLPHEVAIHAVGIPDGRVSAHRATLKDAIEGRLAPGTLLVAPYEHDGHPDHDAVGAVCGEIARQFQLRLWRYPIWSWHRNVPEDFAGQAWGRVPLDKVTRQAKARAMSCFNSQMRPFGRPPILPSHVLSHFARPYEAFLV